MTDTTILLAQRTDLQDIRSLVVELAVFENEPNAVKATILDYEKAFDSGLISCLIAKRSNQIVGMTLFYDTFSTWKGKMLYLEDFYVAKEYRGQGIGQLLFDATLEQATKRDCKLIKWQVLDWNKKAVDFYLKNGATIEKEWWNGKIIF